MTTPFELVVGPVSIYTAPVNEARPDLEDAPAGNWVLLGTNGANNYDEAGVGFDPQQTIEEWYGLGSTGAQQAFRTVLPMRIPWCAGIRNVSSICRWPDNRNSARAIDLPVMSG